MSGFLDIFRKKIFSSVPDQSKIQGSDVNGDDKIALGVLLWVVAEADNKFLPQEQQQIEEVLSNLASIKKEDLPFIMKSIAIAAEERIDLYSFTQEVSGHLTRPKKVEILDNLFRVACADNDLAEEEHEILRKISGLFRLEHKEFIASKIKIKKEFGMDTAGL